MWNYEEFEKIVMIREKIQSKQTLTQADVELLELYELKHWKWADISQKVMQTIDGCDMREVRTYDLHVYKDVKNSVFDDIINMKINGVFINNTVSWFVHGLESKGYVWCNTMDISRYKWHRKY